MSNKNTLKVEVTIIKTGEKVIEEECTSIIAGISGDNVISSFTINEDAHITDILAASKACEQEIRDYESDNSKFAFARRMFRDIDLELDEKSSLRKE